MEANRFESLPVDLLDLLRAEADTDLLDFPALEWALEHEQVEDAVGKHRRGSGGSVLGTVMPLSSEGNEQARTPSCAVCAPLYADGAIAAQMKAEPTLQG